MERHRISIFIGVFVLLSIVCFFGYRIYKKQGGEQPMGMIVCADLHYISPTLVQNGSMFDRYMKMSGRLASYSSYTWEAATASIKRLPEEFVLICGDLSNNGEKQSHIEIANSLKILEKEGKKVFIIPGNNDIQNDRATAYRGDTLYPVSNVNKREFLEIYKDFGYSEAIARDSNSLSYLVDLKDDNCLLAMDATIYDGEICKQKGAFSKETIDWIYSQLKWAKEEGKIVYGMMHYPLVEHFKGEDNLFETAMVEDFKPLSNFLADNQIEFVFTGHLHATDIAYFESLQRNDLYDIATSSLIATPFDYRRVEVYSSEMKVYTESVTDFPIFKNNGKDLNAEYQKLLEETCKYRLKNPPYAFNETLTNLVAPTLSKAMIAHQKGDETVDSSIEAMVKMMKVLNATYNMEFIYSLYKDVPPQDRQITINRKKRN